MVSMCMDYSRAALAAHPAGPAEMRRLGLAHVPEDRPLQALVLPFEARENAILGYPERLGTGPWAGPSAMTAIARPMMTDFDLVHPILVAPIAV